MSLKLTIKQLEVINKAGPPLTVAIPNRHDKIVVLHQSTYQTLVRRALESTGGVLEARMIDLHRAANDYQLTPECSQLKALYCASIFAWDALLAEVLRCDKTGDRLEHIHDFIDILKKSLQHADLPKLKGDGEKEALCHWTQTLSNFLDSALRLQEHDVHAAAEAMRSLGNRSRL